MKYDVSGKVVLITGPARGIGAATARLLAARGARLSLVGLEPERLSEMAAELDGASSCGRHVWFECDVTDQASLERAVAGTFEAFGRIDVVVANAGIASNCMVSVGAVEALVRTIEVNLTGVVRTVSATLRHVADARGYYLLVSSAAAIAPLPGISTYAAAKSGVEQFGNVLRLELAHKGVGVGVAHPSWIDTDMVRDVRQDLQSFNHMLATLPWPFRSVTAVETCAAAFVKAIERRRRKVYVPRSLAPLAALRYLFANPLSEYVLGLNARRLVPQAERETLALKRSFGRHSVETTRRTRPDNESA
ncbi:MAG TPA: SDR family oxidoreductase [Pyrinomonadaceae bacterium]|nr:SDR family oxidoreductase [Pyrinomonadaceae bacterium]